MKNFLALMFLATALLIGCKSSKSSTESAKEESVITSTEKWIISGIKIPCSKESVEECYQVKPAGELEYRLMNVDIEGFDYEPGYKYQIELKVIPSKKTETRYVWLKTIHKVANN